MSSVANEGCNRRAIKKGSRCSTCALFNSELHHAGVLNDLLIVMQQHEGRKVVLTRQTCSLQVEQLLRHGIDWAGDGGGRANDLH